MTREVVICGWKPGKGRREGGVGSLLLGEYDVKGLLGFVGHVGTGFTDRALDELYETLWPLRRDTSPYDEAVPREFAKDAQWVEPRLVGRSPTAPAPGTAACASRPGAASVTTRTPGGHE